MDFSQKDHKAFLALPRVARESAYKAVRARVGPSQAVSVSEMLYVAREMI